MKPIFRVARSVTFALVNVSACKAPPVHAVPTACKASSRFRSVDAYVGFKTKVAKNVLIQNLKKELIYSAKDCMYLVFANVHVP